MCYIHQQPDIRFDRAHSITFGCIGLIYCAANRIEQTQINGERPLSPHIASIEACGSFADPKRTRCATAIVTVKWTYGGQLIICLLCFIIYCFGDAISHWMSYKFRLWLIILHRMQRNINFPIRITLYTCFGQSSSSCTVRNVSTDCKCRIIENHQCNDTQLLRMGIIAIDAMA